MKMKFYKADQMQLIRTWN